MQAAKWRDQKSLIWSEQERKWALEELLGRSFDPTQVLSVEQLKTLENWTLRLSQGEPFAYVLGNQEFRGNRYSITPAVLIPRFETEGLVELALSRMGSRVGFGIEVGLGSGVISVELLNRHPQLRMLATEASSEAIDVAKKNAQSILGEQESGRFRFKKVAVGQVLSGVQDDWLFEESADFLISNPPYLSGPDEALKRVVSFEPAAALFAPQDDYLFFYRRISEESPQYLKREGQVFLELPHERAVVIGELFSKGNWKDIEIQDDLNGRPRYLVATRRS